MNYKEFRIGSPVIVNGRYTHIKSLPSNNDPFYCVWGFGNGFQANDIISIPVDNQFYSTYKQHIQQGRIVFKNGAFKVELDIPSNDCWINGKRYGIVESLHELKNILEDEANYYITYYIPKTNEDND